MNIIMPEKTDQELLTAFSKSGNQSAFTQLVQRHGPMVMATCQRKLGNAGQAEDAFQATFIVLAQKAGKIKMNGSLGGWLNRVACYSASDLIKKSARRKRHEEKAAQMQQTSYTAEQVQPVNEKLDDALNHLPAKYRDVLVLCYLENKTREEAATQLGLTLPQIKGLLTRGKEKLKKRLLAAGLPAAALVPGYMPSHFMSPVSSTLLDSTVQAAIHISTGQAAAAGMTSTSAYAISQGVMNTMTIAKVKSAVAAAVVAAGLTSASVFAGSMLAPTPPEADFSDALPQFVESDVKQEAPITVAGGEWDKKDYEKKSWEKKTYDKKSYDKKKDYEEKKSWEKKTYDKKSYDKKKDYEEKKWEAKSDNANDYKLSLIEKRKTALTKEHYEKLECFKEKKMNAESESKAKFWDTAIKTISHKYNKKMTELENEKAKLTYTKDTPKHTHNKEFVEKKKWEEKKDSRPSKTALKRITRTKIAYRVVDDKVIIRWAPKTKYTSDGVKIVYADHDNPVYPHDKAIWRAGTGLSEAKIYIEELPQGKPFYLRVCVVKRGDHNQFDSVSQVIKFPALKDPHAKENKHDWKKKEWEKKHHEKKDWEKKSWDKKHDEKEVDFDDVP